MHAPLDRSTSATRLATALLLAIGVAGGLLANLACRPGSVARTAASYSIPQGHLPDDGFDGEGDPSTPLSPLTAGLGELTDGVIPVVSASEDAGPWVGWNEHDPSLVFDFGERVAVDRVSLVVDAPTGAAGGVAPPVQARLEMGGATRIIDLSAPEGGPATIDLAGLGLLGQFLEIRLTRGDRWLMVGEVSFRGRKGFACNDGRDGDGDGLVDAADPGCASPQDRWEFDGRPGDLFVADAGRAANGAIWHVDPETGDAQRIVDGAPFAAPHGLAFDRGDLLFSDASGPGLYRLDLADGTVTRVPGGTTVGSPGGLAVLRRSDPMVVDRTTGSLVRLDPAGGATASAGAYPADGVARGFDGRLWVASAAGRVLEWNPVTGALEPFVSVGLSGPGALAVDPRSGDLWVADTAAGRVASIDLSLPHPAAEPLATDAPAFGELRGIAVADAETLYVSDADANKVYRIDHGPSPAVVTEATSRSFDEPREILVFGHGEEGWVPGPDGEEWTRYRVEEGYAIWRGDVSLELGRLRRYQADLIANFDDPIYRASLRGDGAWPDGYVYYDPASILPFDDPEARCVDYDVQGDCTATQGDHIRDAIDLWERNTLIDFVPDASGEQFVRFVPMSEGCSAGVGWRYGGEPVTEVNLGSRCEFGSIVHELGHTIGLWHEQSRNDRDAHVKVNLDNVEEGRERNFDKSNGTDFGQYNYRSVMHYGRNYFGRRACCSAQVDPSEPVPAGICLTLEEDEDICPESHRSARGYESSAPLTLHTLVPYMAFPSEGSVGIGYRVSHAARLDPTALSKGDISAASAMTMEVAERPWAWRHGESEIIALGRVPEAREVEVGDFNGDGRADVALFRKGPFQSGAPGDVHFLFSAAPWAGFRPGIGGPEYEYRGVLHELFCLDHEWCSVGDVNADGLDDLVTFNPDGAVWVSLATGDGFLPSTRWHERLGAYGDDFFVADVDGDCDADAIAIDYIDSEIQPRAIVYVVKSAAENGVDSFHDVWSYPIQYASPYGVVVDVADVTGDHAEDLVMVSRHEATYGDVRIHASLGTSFEPVPETWAEEACGPIARCRIADMDGDVWPDLVVMDLSAGHYVPDLGREIIHRLDRVRIHLSTGSAFSDALNFHELDCPHAFGCLLGDVDADGRADLVDPVRAGDGEPGREPGDVRVSRQRSFWTDPIGPSKPTGLIPPRVCGLPSVGG